MVENGLEVEETINGEFMSSMLVPNTIACNGCLYHKRFFDFKGKKIENLALLSIRPQQRRTTDLCERSQLLLTGLGDFLHKICKIFKCNMP